MKYDIKIEIKGLKSVCKNFFEAKLNDFIEEFEEVYDSVGITKTQIYEEDGTTTEEPFYVGKSLDTCLIDISKMSISNSEKAQAYINEDGLHWKIEKVESEK